MPIRKLTKVNLVPQELDPEPRKRARFPRKFSSSTDTWKAPRKPEDPFFSQPYVPGRTSVKKTVQQNLQDRLPEKRGKLLSFLAEPDVEIRQRFEISPSNAALPLNKTPRAYRK